MPGRKDQDAWSVLELQLCAAAERFARKTDVNTGVGAGGAALSLSEAHRGTSNAFVDETVAALMSTLLLLGSEER